MDSSQKRLLIAAIEKAIKREIGAYNFYLKEAVKADYDVAEALFFHLANEEEKHKTYLQKELARFKTIVADKQKTSGSSDKMGYQIPEFIELRQNQPLPFIDMSLVTMPADMISGDHLETYIIEGKNKSPLLGLFLHDVMGHGEESVHLNSIIKLWLSKTYATQDLKDRRIDLCQPEKLLAGLNQHVYKICHENFKFVTAFYAIIDYHEKNLIYASAGHEPPILIRKNGEYIHLDQTELVLGGMEDTSYTPVSVDFELGDVIVLFSDGITEVTNEEDQMFERDNVISAIKSVHNYSANEILNTIINKLKDHVKGQPIQDDFSLAVLKVIKS